MSPATFLILRRMRAPLLFLIGAYAVAVGGLVLMPGPDVEGVPRHMSFFHAFYVISYTATTIGFGEVPYAFSDAQRMWTTLSIYLTVIAWLYSIGTIIALLQDPAYRQVRTSHRFIGDVRRLRDRFYLICGFGDTGSLLVRALTDRGKRAVAIDVDPQRINVLAVQDYDSYVPGLCGDAAIPENLMAGGLRSPRCTAVVALTNDDQVNLTIAIAGKLLHPQMQVISRASTLDAAINMASFDTDYIINPFQSFADHLALALRSPSVWLLHEWLTGVPNTALIEPRYPPSGTWIVCGYGRFGKAVVRQLRREGVSVVIVEADSARTGCEACVRGRGTEEDTLAEAGVFGAAGIVAGTDNDANNLSIVMTARAMNPELFVVIRQNRHANDALFQAAGADLVMHVSDILVHEIIALITAPTLSRFLARTRRQGKSWANELVSRISAVTEELVPEIWEIRVGERQARAVAKALAAGKPITVGELLKDPHDRAHVLPCIPLMLSRGDHAQLLPSAVARVEVGDHLLFCGKHGAAPAMRWTLQNDKVLHYLLTGREMPETWVWEWIDRRLARQGRGELIASAEVDPWRHS
jgi:voltage-gated potassium channel